MLKNISQYTHKLPTVDKFYCLHVFTVPKYCFITKRTDVEEFEYHPYYDEGRHYNPEFDKYGLLYRYSKNFRLYNDAIAHLENLIPKYYNHEYPFNFEEHRVDPYFAIKMRNVINQMRGMNEEYYIR